MSEQPQGGQGTGPVPSTQAGEPPAPPPVPVIGAAVPAAKPEVDEDALAKRIAAQVIEIIRPQVQSTSAKVASGTAYAAMRELGIDDIAKRAGVEPAKLQEAVRQKVMDDIVDERLSGQRPPTGRGDAATSQSVLEAQTSEFLAKVARESGVTFTPQELEEAAKARVYYSAADWLGELFIRGQKKMKGASITPSAALGEGGSPPPPPPDLRAKYEQELKQIRRGDVKAVVALKNRYRKLGLTDI